MGRNTKALVWALVVIIIVAVGAWYFTRNTAQSPSGIPAAGAVTLSGQMACLPHHDQSAPHTLECAYGLQGDDGNYYALTSAASTSAITSYSTGTHIEVQGTFTPGTDPTYDTVGSILIDSITPLNGTSTSATSSASTSDGMITFSTPQDFGLATTPDQVLAKAYIPPCDQGFDYCLYYNGTAYQGTNFESAGLSIRKRPDLSSQSACLATQPQGYSGLHATSTTQTSYAMSVFGPVGDAGAGHYASGQEYRLFTNATCYQFDTRVGETQFANYPAGSITQFTDAERESMFATLRGILSNITLPGGVTLSLPQ